MLWQWTPYTIPLALAAVVHDDGEWRYES